MDALRAWRFRSRVPECRNGTNGSVTPRVDYYLDGSTLLGTATVSPYKVTWTTMKFPLGNHVLTAVATDVAGNSTVSSGVSVTITP